MSNLRAYPIIILAIFLLSILFPKMYKDIFSSRIDKQRVVYSPVEEDFIKITTLAGKERKVIYSNITETKKYSLDEYKAKLPFTYYYDLLRTNNFPQEFISYGQNINAIRKEKSFLKLNPKYINTKVVNLYPLFESNPKYSSLTLPDELFRLDKAGITFINTSKNEINKEKSKLYNKLFLQEGAVFPLKDAYGTPSIQKPFDEGYFIKDSKNQLFHLKQVDGKASLNKVDLKGIDLVFALIKEDTRKEYYGLLIDKNSNLYLMMYDDYELVKLPINTYNYKVHEFKIKTTLINRIITITSINESKNTKLTKTYVTNLDYELIKENSFEYTFKGSALYENTKELLFPFRLAITKEDKAYYSFEIRDFSKKAFIINILLAFCFLIYVKMSKRELKKHLIQTIFIAIAGIYSLIVLLLFEKLVKNKTLKFKEG